MKIPNYYKKSIQLLEELYRKYPTQTLGQHISTAFSDYPDLWPVSHKEFYYALEKYNSQKELDILHIAPEDYVQKIVDDGAHLFDEGEQEDEIEFE